MKDRWTTEIGSLNKEKTPSPNFPPSDAMPEGVGAAGKEQTGDEIEHRGDGVVVGAAAVHRLEGLPDDLVVADDGQVGGDVAVATAIIATIEQE